MSTVGDKMELPSPPHKESQLRELGRIEDPVERCKVYAELVEEQGKTDISTKDISSRVSTYLQDQKETETPEEEQGLHSKPSAAKLLMEIRKIVQEATSSEKKDPATMKNTLAELQQVLEQ